MASNSCSVSNKAVQIQNNFMLIFIKICNRVVVLHDLLDWTSISNKLQDSDEVLITGHKCSLPAKGSFSFLFFSNQS